MINFEMWWDYLCIYFSSGTDPFLPARCVGFSYPASSPEVFICMPGLFTILIALCGLLVWEVCIMTMLGYDVRKPILNLFKRKEN
jgi:hypothetical protein